MTPTIIDYVKLCPLNPDFIEGQYAANQLFSENKTFPYRLSIVVPAYNEEARIGASIDHIAEYISGLGYRTELIVVDDGSSDSTKEIVMGKKKTMPSNCMLHLISYIPNQGKGAAVKTGCLTALGKYVLFSDADLATPIEEWPRLERSLIEGVDVSIGTRVWPTGEDKRTSQPLFRRVFGKVYHLLVLLFVVREFPDTQCGFKAMTNETAQRLFSLQSLKGIVFDTELLYLTKKLNLKVAQIPVEWSNIGGSRMRVTINQAVSVLADLVSIPGLHRKDINK